MTTIDTARTILATAMVPGRRYRGTAETYDLDGMEFTLTSLGEAAWTFEEPDVPQLPAVVVVGTETWDDLTIPGDAHVIPLDAEGEPVEPSEFTCTECGTRVAETFVVTTLDNRHPRTTRTEVCLPCQEVLAALLGDDQ